LLSANHAALSYLRAIGTQDRLIGPPKPDFDFIDLADGARWTLRISEGRAPWWIFDSGRRVPGTRVAEYLRLARLLRAHPERTVGQTIACSGPLYERLVHPLLLAALNTEPSEASATLAGAIVRETLAAGGAACRPLIARDGLGEAFVEPAVTLIERRGGEVKLRHELRALRFENGRVSALDFGDGVAQLGPSDAVIIAVPPFAATPLVPDLSTPTAYRAIVNAHFRVVPPAGFPSMIGVLNGVAEWIFAFRQRLSVTISNADRLLETPRETLAYMIWQDVARTAGLSGEMPPWQIVRERRATFAATPEENAKRPAARTRWSNLLLAGDWTDTGLPATIESAIRSGQRAADFANQGLTTTP
jgi:squalene-associated FAD-dependent desaturase